jgi:hypothetical protein
MAYNDVPQMVAGMKAKTMYESLADNGYSWTNAFQEVPYMFIITPFLCLILTG